LNIPFFRKESFTKGKSDRIEEFDLTRKKIFVGSDYSILYPIVKYLPEHDEVAKVIIIDAHADFRDSYKNNRFPNACVTRRIAELIGFKNIIEVGVRSSSEDEYAALNQIRIYDADIVREKGVEWLLKEIENGEKNPIFLLILMCSTPV
jgi:arginase family enzyme